VVVTKGGNPYRDSRVNPVRAGAEGRFRWSQHNGADPHPRGGWQMNSPARLPFFFPTDAGDCSSLFLSVLMLSPADRLALVLPRAARDGNDNGQSVGWA
jgi:hypothetical protein